MGLGWPSGVRANGTLADGAAGGQPGHAERSEASRRPSRETLRCAHGDKNAAVRVSLSPTISGSLAKIPPRRISTHPMLRSQSEAILPPLRHGWDGILME